MCSDLQIRAQSRWIMRVNVTCVFLGLKYLERGEERTMIKWTLYLALAVALYSLTGLLAQIVTWDIISHVMVRSGIGLGVALILVLRDLRKPTLRESVAGVCVALPSATFIVITWLSNAVYAIVLLYLSTLFSAMIRRVVTGNKLPIQFWLAWVVTLVGLWLMTIDSKEPLDALSILLGIVGSVAWAFWSVLREGDGEKRSDYSLVIGFFLSTLIFLFLPRSLFGLQTRITSDWASIVGVIGGGVLAGTAYQIMSKATEKIRAPFVLLISSAEVPLTVFWLWAFLGNIPGTTSCIGAGMAFLAVVWLGYVMNTEKANE